MLAMIEKRLLLLPLVGLLIGSSPSTSGVIAADYEFPDSRLSRLAFGSCHKNKYANTEHSIWKTIQEKSNPQLWLWTGDAVYSRRGVATIEELGQEYSQLRENATIGYSSFRPPLGIFGTWDDHDYGGNDAGYELPEKQARANLFREFIGQSTVDPAREGVYSSLTVGVPPQQVKIIMLDTRWSRDKHCIPSVATKIPLGAGFACLSRWLSAGLNLCQASTASMLGKEQWKWLQNELSFDKDEAPALALVVSSVQVLTVNPVMEGWGHFPLERDRLIRLLGGLADRTSVFILSGDVHHGEILDPLALKEDTFLEVTSSGLTHDCAEPIYGGLCKPLLETFSAHRWRSPQNYFIGKNYGTVDINWEDGKVEIKVLDDSGQPVLSTGPRTLQVPHPSWNKEEMSSIRPTIDGHLIVWFRFVIVSITLVGSIFLILRKTAKRTKTE